MQVSALVAQPISPCFHAHSKTTWLPENLLNRQVLPTERCGHMWAGMQTGARGRDQIEVEKG